VLELKIHLLHRIREEASNGQFYYPTDGEVSDASRMVRYAGATWLRIDLLWPMIQATGPESFDWTYQDRMIKGAIANGLKVIALPTYSPSWATDGPSAGYYPNDVTAWQTFLEAAARRYMPMGVSVWEIWNEPNYGSESDPALYTSDILKPASETLRAVANELGKPVTILSAAAANRIGDMYVTDPYDWCEGIYTSGARAILMPMRFTPIANHIHQANLMLGMPCLGRRDSHHNGTVWRWGQTDLGNRVWLPDAGIWLRFGT